MGTRDLPDMYARSPRAAGPRAYISGKSRVHMLQVICNTSGTLKICPNLTSIFPPLYILVVIVGLYFIIVMTFLHGSAGNCGFTTKLHDL